LQGVFTQNFTNVNSTLRCKVILSIDYVMEGQKEGLI
jgi:hypothetical protein